jgi:hypothetical protein
MRGSVRGPVDCEPAALRRIGGLMLNLGPADNRGGKVWAAWPIAIPHYPEHFKIQNSFCLSPFLSITFPVRDNNWLSFHQHSRLFLRSIFNPFCFHQHSRFYLHFTISFLSQL